MSKLKGYRTVALGALLSILGLFEQYAREIVPDEYQGWTLFVVGILIVLLRLVTTTPVGNRY
jgi:hypothetical protein